MLLEGRRIGRAALIAGAAALASWSCHASFHIGDMHDVSAAADAPALAGALHTPERQAADAFLATLTSQGAAAAYALGAARLHADLTLNAWEAYAARERFADARSVAWAAQGRQGDLTALTGALRFPSGQVEPLRVVITPESGVWKVAAITETEASARASPTPAGDAPTGGAPIGGDLGGSSAGGIGATTTAGRHAFSAAEVGAHCLSTLSPRVRLDTVTCPSELQLTPGATETCVARSGATTGVVVATSTGIESGNRAGLDCHVRIALPAPAGGSVQGGERP